MRCVSRRTSTTTKATSTVWSKCSQLPFRLQRMGFIEVADLSSKLPGGRVLFEDVSFRVYSGQHAALIGANGVGKTTLLRILAGSDEAKSGAMRIDGRVLYMRQMIGSISDDTTVRGLL